MRELYALVPLFSRQGLGVAIVSYDGGLFVGLHTDPCTVPDAGEVARDIAAAFEELEAHAASVARAARGASAARDTPQEAERPREARPT